MPNLVFSSVKKKNRVHKMQRVHKLTVLTLDVYCFLLLLQLQGLMPCQPWNGVYSCSLDVHLSGLSWHRKWLYDELDFWPSGSLVVLDRSIFHYLLLNLLTGDACTV